MGTNRPGLESNMTIKRVVLKFHNSEISLSTLFSINTYKSTKKFDIFNKYNFHYFFKICYHRILCKLSVI